ncbi:MAG TPA: hypothetical protein VF221_16990 [Chloroflexota bacterium]
MKYIHRFLTFWYDFIVGDDWTIAASVVAALVLTDWLAHQGTQAWWLLPLVVIATTGLSLRRAVMASQQRG